MSQNTEKTTKDLTSCSLPKHEESFKSSKEDSCFNPKEIKNTVLDNDNVILSNNSNKKTNPLPTNNSEVPSLETIKPAKNLRKTEDLLDVLQKALVSPAKSSTNYVVPVETVMASKLFKIRLYIDSATNLPRNKKKGSKRMTKCKQSRFPPNEEPSTYVTFQMDAGFGPMVKSHEGMVYATNVCEKSSNPNWNFSFDIGIPTDFLTNPQKRFILKIWKKSTIEITNYKLLPTPLEDSIIGFTAVDLTVLPKGNIYGWFNIVDFSGRLNGQIKVKVQPLDNIEKIKVPTSSADMLPQAPFPCDAANILNDIGPNTNIDLNNTQLSRAIKRKFTELEEITQRLRARLFDVTGEADTNTEMTDVDDLQLDEFERDLNTACSEEDTKVDWFKKVSTSNILNQSDDKLEGETINDKTSNTPEKIHMISEFLERTEITDSIGSSRGENQLQCEDKTLSLKHNGNL